MKYPKLYQRKKDYSEEINLKRLKRIKFIKALPNYT